jgi:putative membrane protein
MPGSEFYWLSFWWIFPLVMIVLCFLMMRGRMGCMMGGSDAHGTNSNRMETSDSAMEVLDKRYAMGEINREEYEERKKVLNGQG